MSAIGFNEHDHSVCIASSIEHADRTCTDKGLQLTPIRKRVLEILLQEHKAMGAYDILDLLRKDGFGSQPPIVYRALDFLIQNNFVHKVEKLNAYVACNHPDGVHAPAFLICRLCSAVAEANIEPKSGLLSRSAKDTGFQIETTVQEAEGICPKCQQA